MSLDRDEHRRLRRSDRVAVRDLGTVVLIGDPAGSAQVLRLPGVSRLVWDALEQPASAEDIEAQLRAQADLPDNRENVRVVLDLLSQLGAVVSA